MNFLPVFYNISAKPCLIVGGGAIAARKAELLLRAGGKLRVVSPESDDRFREMATSQALELVQRAFAADDLTGMVCVIAATNDMAVSIASRVLPTPPGPVRVTKRSLSRRPTNSCNSERRPTKLVNGVGRFPETCVVSRESSRCTSGRSTASGGTKSRAGS